MKKRYLIMTAAGCGLIAFFLFIIYYYLIIIGTVFYEMGNREGIQYVLLKMGDSGNPQYVSFIRKIYMHDDYGEFEGDILQCLPQFPATKMVDALLIDADVCARKYGDFLFAGRFAKFTGKELTAGLWYLLYYRYPDEITDTETARPMEKVKIFEIWFKNNLPYLKRHMGVKGELRLSSDTRPLSKYTLYWEVDIEAKVCGIPYKKWHAMGEKEKAEAIRKALGISAEELSRMSEEDVRLKIQYTLASKGLDPILYTSLDPDPSEMTKEEWYDEPSFLKAQMYLLQKEERPIHQLFIERYNYNRLKQKS